MINSYLGGRICGDAFILRLNERACQPEPANEVEKLHNAVYEDVPRELIGSDLLTEIMTPTEWKVLFPRNVVKLHRSRSSVG